MALSKGDKVHWSTSQGKTTGTTVEKKTKEFTFDGQKFKPHSGRPLLDRGVGEVRQACGS
jgi:hypothetical protein